MKARNSLFIFIGLLLIYFPVSILMFNSNFFSPPVHHLSIKYQLVSDIDIKALEKMISFEIGEDSKSVQVYSEEDDLLVIKLELSKFNEQDIQSIIKEKYKDQLLLQEENLIGPIQYTKAFYLLLTGMILSLISGSIFILYGIKKLLKKLDKTIKLE